MTTDTTARKPRTLNGSEVTADIMKRLSWIESVLICRPCAGSGVIHHRTLGEIECFPCGGSGNRLDALEKRL